MEPCGNRCTVAGPAGLMPVPSSIDVQGERTVLAIEDGNGFEKAVCPSAFCRTLSGEVVAVLVRGDTFYIADGNTDITNIDSPRQRMVYVIDRGLLSETKGIVEIFARSCSVVDVDGDITLAKGLPQPLFLIGAYPPNHPRYLPWRSTAGRDKSHRSSGPLPYPSTA